MYLHLGNEFIIDKRKIIGIFDIENTSTSHITKDFLNKNSKKIKEISFEEPKSFILTNEKILISNISSTTLKKRFCT